MVFIVYILYIYVIYIIYIIVLVEIYYEMNNRFNRQHSNDQT